MFFCFKSAVSLWHDLWADWCHQCAAEIQDTRDGLPVNKHNIGFNWNRLCYHIFSQSLYSLSMRKLNWCLFLVSLSQFLWEFKQSAQLFSQSFSLTNIWSHYFYIQPSCKRIKPLLTKEYRLKHCIAVFSRALDFWAVSYTRFERVAWKTG